MGKFGTLIEILQKINDSTAKDLSNRHCILTRID